MLALPARARGHEDHLDASRGPTQGGPVYGAVDALPQERGDLAILRVSPQDAIRAIDLAAQAGCRRVWFSRLVVGARTVEAAITFHGRVERTERGGNRVRPAGAPTSAPSRSVRKVHAANLKRLGR